MQFVQKSRAHLPFFLWPLNHVISDRNTCNFQAVRPCAGEGVKQSFCSQHHTLQSSFRLTQYSWLEAEGMARPTCTSSHVCRSRQQATRCIRTTHKSKLCIRHSRQNWYRQCSSSHAFSILTSREEERSSSGYEAAPCCEADKWNLWALNYFNSAARLWDIEDTCLELHQSAMSSVQK